LPRQSLSSREHWKLTKKTLGKDHSDAANVLENMADFHEEIEKREEVGKIAERAKKIR